MHLPSVRALHLRTLVGALPALGAERGAAARAATPPRTLARIESAGTLDWLPAELLVDLCCGAHAVVGAEALEEWGHAALEAVVKAPLARAFVEAATFVTGRRPDRILHALTQAWPLLYRGCGDLVVTASEPGLARLVHAPVPPLLRRRETLLPLVGALGAVPRLCGVPGGSATAEWDAASPRFAYTVRWPAVKTAG